MKLHNFFYFFLLAFFVNACGSIKGDDFNKDAVKKIGISSAKSVAVTKTGEYSSKLIKFSDETSEPEDVKFYDENDNELNFDLSFVEIFNVNEDYMVVCLGQFSYAQACYLVNLETGDMHILADTNDNNNMPKSSGALQYPSQTVFKSDANNNIFYLSSEGAVVKVDTSDLANISRQKMSLINEDVYAYTVSADGDIAYLGFNNSLENSEISKIVLENGITFLEEFEVLWTAADGKIYVSHADDDRFGTVISKLNNATIEESAFIASTYIYINSIYIFNIIDANEVAKTVILDTNSKKLIELTTSDGSELNIIDLSNSISKINKLSFNNNWLFMAISNDPKLVAINFGWSYGLLNPPAYFANYNITDLFVIDENEIIFTAEDLTNAGTIINAKYHNYEIEIIETITNEIVSLIKIN